MLKNNNNIPFSPKTKYKPEIEQFEYLIKINEEKKKLLSEMRKLTTQPKPNNENIPKKIISSPQSIFHVSKKKKIFYTKKKIKLKVI